MDVTVVVATYGPLVWQELARARAIPSVTGAKVVAVHGDSLHEARNEALESVDTEWVCHLDADDELTSDYFDVMSAATADIRVPQVQYIHGDRVRPARHNRVRGHSHRCTADCLSLGNWLVVGAVVRTDLVREVGGWRDWVWSEDWDLWLRCRAAGATFEAVPAVYVSHVRSDSLNHGASNDTKNRLRVEIAAANGL